MNKIIQINLGGYPFTIDDDAYEHLGIYLKTIHNHFKSSEGYEEITSDIESRIAELFREHKEGGNIIGTKDVKKAISIMGTTEDFGAEPMADTNGTATGTDRIKTGKRLYSNPEDAVIGGVSSGIASYFGMEDPLWVRLGFILATFMFGFAIPVYIVLWLILPKAESAADKLAMRGEKIDISSIARVIEEEVDDLSSRLSGAATGKKKSGGVVNSFIGFLSTMVSFIGKMFGFVITLFVSIWKPLFFIILLTVAISIAISLLSLVAGLFLSFPFISYISHHSVSSSGLSIFNLFMILVIPGMFMIMACIKAFTKKSYLNNYWKTGIWSFWGLNLVSLGFLGASLATQFNQFGKTVLPYDLTTVYSDTLKINGHRDVNSSISRTLFELELGDGFVASKNVTFDLRKGESDDFKLRLEKTSAGRNIAQAESLANKIDYMPVINGNELDLSSTFRIMKGEKWRDQGVRVILEVPEGKYVQFDNGFREFHSYDYDSNDPDFGIRSTIGELWTMEENGLVCATCDPDGRSLQKVTDYKDFSSLNIDGGMKVKIVKGNNYNIQIDANKRSREKVNFQQLGDRLTISSENSRHNRVNLEITMPALNAIDFKDSHDVEITGFEQDRMEINYVGREDLTALVNVDSMYIRQDGRGNISLTGKGDYLYVSLDGEAHLNAERFEVNVADVKTEGRSLANLFVNKLIREKSDSDRIRVKRGDPERLGMASGNN